MNSFKYLFAYVYVLLMWFFSLPNYCHTKREDVANKTPGIKLFFYGTFALHPTTLHGNKTQNFADFILNNKKKNQTVMSVKVSAFTCWDYTASSNSHKRAQGHTPYMQHLQAEKCRNRWNRTSFFFWFCMPFEIHKIRFTFCIFSPTLPFLFANISFGFRHVFSSSCV